MDERMRVERDSRKQGLEEKKRLAEKQETEEHYRNMMMMERWSTEMHTKYQKSPAIPSHSLATELDIPGFLYMAENYPVLFLSQSFYGPHIGQSHPPCFLIHKKELIPHRIVWDVNDCQDRETKESKLITRVFEDIQTYNYKQKENLGKSENQSMKTKDSNTSKNCHSRNPNKNQEFQYKSSYYNEASGNTRQRKNPIHPLLPISAADRYHARKENVVETTIRNKFNQGNNSDPKSATSSNGINDDLTTDNTVDELDNSHAGTDSSFYGNVAAQQTDTLVHTPGYMYRDQEQDNANQSTDFQNPAQNISQTSQDWYWQNSQFGQVYPPNTQLYRSCEPAQHMDHQSTRRPHQDQSQSDDYSNHEQEYAQHFSQQLFHQSQNEELENPQEYEGYEHNSHAACPNIPAHDHSRRKPCHMVAGSNPTEVHPMQETLFNFQQFLIDELPSADNRQMGEKRGHGVVNAPIEDYIELSADEEEVQDGINLEDSTFNKDIIGARRGRGRGTNMDTDYIPNGSRGRGRGSNPTRRGSRGPRVSRGVSRGGASLPGTSSLRGASRGGVSLPTSSRDGDSKPGTSKGAGSGSSSRGVSSSSIPRGYRRGSLARGTSHLKESGMIKQTGSLKKGVGSNWIGPSTEGGDEIYSESVSKVHLVPKEVSDVQANEINSAILATVGATTSVRVKHRAVTLATRNSDPPFPTAQDHDPPFPTAQDHDPPFPTAQEQETGEECYWKGLEPFFCVPSSSDQQGQQSSQMQRMKNTSDTDTDTEENVKQGMLDLCGMPAKENDQQLEQLLATITKDSLDESETFDLEAFISGREDKIETENTGGCHYLPLLQDSELEAHGDYHPGVPELKTPSRTDCTEMSSPNDYGNFGNLTSANAGQGLRTPDVGCGTDNNSTYSDALKTPE